MRRSGRDASRPSPQQGQYGFPRNTNHGFYAFHEPRLFQPYRFPGRQTFLLERTKPPPRFSRITNHETRITAFPAFPVPRPTNISPGANQTPCPRFSRNTNTKHESRVLRFPRDTRHKTRLFPDPALTQAAVEQRPLLGFGVTKHESRNTNHGFYSSSYPIPAMRVAGGKSQQIENAVDAVLDQVIDVLRLRVESGQGRSDHGPHFR